MPDETGGRREDRSHPEDVGENAGPPPRELRQDSRWRRYAMAAIEGPGATGTPFPGNSAAGGQSQPSRRAPASAAVVEKAARGRSTEASGAPPGVRLVRRLRARAAAKPEEVRIYPLLELRLVPVAAASWSAAAAAVRTPGGEAEIGGAVLAAAALIFLMLARGPGRSGTLRPHMGDRGGRRQGGYARTVARAAAVPTAAAALVCVCSGVLLAERTAGPISAVIAEGRSVTGVFRAVTDARAVAADKFSGEPRYVTETVLEEAASGGKKFPAAATVLVIGGSGYRNVQLGDRFRAAGPLQGTEPGERSIALLYANGQPRVEAAGGWYGHTARIRTTFSAEARHYAGVMGGDAAGLLPGMVLGDRSALNAELESAMKNTGLTHITAVSGANCGYLLAFVFLLARAVRLPRSVAAGAGVLALLAFVLVVRPDASVLRAAVMGSLGTIAVLSGRGKLPAALLCLSITVLLSVDPWLSGSYAFILSVLATGGLILLGPRLTEVLARRLPWTLAAALAVPLAAQLFCSPVLLLLQPQLPAFSLPANVAVAPVVPLVTVAGMLAAVVAAVVPAAAGPLVVVSGAGAAWTAGVARFFDGLPGSLVPWPAGLPGVLLMVAVTGAAVALLWRLGPQPAGKYRGTAEAGRSRHLPPANTTSSRLRAAQRRYSATAVALLLLPAAVAGVWSQMWPGPAAPGWVAAACDVGQGDGLVVRTAEHRAVVIDAGPDPEAMDRCLDRLQVETVDLFVLSHAHLDHYGGAAGVLRDRLVHRIAYSTAETDLPPPLRTLLADSGAETIRLTEGMASRAGAVDWEVLWPPPGSIAPNENDASTVILMSVDPVAATAPASGEGAEVPAEIQEFAGVPPLTGHQLPADGRLTLLLTGDIEEDAAAALLARDEWLGNAGVDVLKVPHHGSRNGGTALIEEVKPRVALISVGADNDYGHPGAEILQSLQQTGTVIARTDQLGSVGLAVEGTTLQVFRVGGP